MCKGTGKEVVMVEVDCCSAELPVCRTQVGCTLYASACPSSYLNTATALPAALREKFLSFGTGQRAPAAAEARRSQTQTAALGLLTFALSMLTILPVR
jgi:hypothetical protein